MHGPFLNVKLEIYPRYNAAVTSQKTVVAKWLSLQLP